MVKMIFLGSTAGVNTDYGGHDDNGVYTQWLHFFYLSNNSEVRLPAREFWCGCDWQVEHYTWAALQEGGAVGETQTDTPFPLQEEKQLHGGGRLCPFLPALPTTNHQVLVKENSKIQTQHNCRAVNVAIRSASSKGFTGRMCCTGSFSGNVQVPLGRLFIIFSSFFSNSYYCRGFKVDGVLVCFFKLHLFM